jgi:hypothetical protein
MLKTSDINIHQEGSSDPSIIQNYMCPDYLISELPSEVQDTLDGDELYQLACTYMDIEECPEPQGFEIFLRDNGII